MDYATRFVRRCQRQRIFLEIVARLPGRKKCVLQARAMTTWSYEFGNVGRQRIVKSGVGVIRHSLKNGDVAMMRRKAVGKEHGWIASGRQAVLEMFNMEEGSSLDRLLDFLAKPSTDDRD